MIMNLFELNMIGQRLKTRRKQLRLTQADIAKFCSVSKSSVSDWEKDLFQPKDKDLLAQALKTTKEWLLTGKGAVEVLPLKNNQLSVPLINWVQAGTWMNTAEGFAFEDAEEYYPCPEKHSSSTFALTVVGESMAPDFIPGEIIYVDPCVEAASGSYVVVRQNGDTEATFKQLMLDGSRKYLKALNPNWPNPIIEMLPDADVCGVVIGSYRKRN